MELGEETVDGVLEDYRTAPIGEPLRAMLGFLEKMTLWPDGLAARDGEALRAAGLSEQAIDDAIVICTGFQIIDRIADALGFHIPDAASFQKMAKILLRFGYKT